MHVCFRLSSKFFGEQNMRTVALSFRFLNRMVRLFIMQTYKGDFVFNYDVEKHNWLSKIPREYFDDTIVL